jgi:LuxR family maltose regulon positive regulatory protein
MASHSVTLAKLSRPKLFGVLERERLFAALDAARRHPAVWIAGPPGAGKTTLVTSYLQARKLPCLWYQVDSGDADPASFFYYLAQAVPSTRGARREPLRLLTPDYLADLPGFARRFFRTLFERLPARAALVLDNFQQAGDSAAFHALVAIALAEARDGINLIVLSRTDPPASFARELANGLIGTIGWDELRLTDDETRAIATARREVDAATLALLQQQSAGWAAGLMLILQGLEHTGAVRPALPAETLEAVFGYFAGHVLDQVPAATRELLMRTAFLPRVNAAAAQALTGNADAASLLDQLYRQRLFTDRHAGGAVSYQYHALFREFLQSRVDAAYTAEQRRALRQRSAELLESDGESADALRLHVANADWEAATALILKRARALIAEGRWLTLEAWVALLPKEQVARTPWLMLWLGSSLILVDPARAQAMLQSAFELFVADGDALGQALVATGAVESCNIDAADFSTLDPWIAVLERLLQPGTLVFPSAATRLRVNVAMMLATTLRQPSHPMLSVCLREVLATFDHDIALTAKTDTATQLLQFFDFVGDLQGAVALVERVAPWFERDDLSPFRRAGWLVFFSYHAALVGSYRQGFDALDGLRAIVRDYGMRWFGFFDLLFRSLLTLLGPTPMAATPFLHQIGTSVRSSRPAQFSQYHLARALLYQSQGEASLAIYHGELCLEAGKRCGGALFAILFPTVIASAYVEAGQTERALALVAEARALGSGTPYRSYEALMLMVEAYAHSRRGDASAARDLLARALVRGRDEQTTSLFRWLVAGFRRMLALALRDDIEADCARSLIAQFGVAAESAEVEPWPWPIRIRALGGFALEIGGVPSQPQRKAQKKPLELLKYVVAQGRHDVSAAHLDAALWPDAEGGAAAEAFEVTLRRLRKLLGNDEAIALKDGKLSLNEGICWVDTWAFERAQAKAEKMLGAGGEPASIEADIDAQGERVLALYPGHFLAGDDEKPWLVGCRQRLASKFLRHVGALGQFWQDRGEPGKAELAYRRAIELDPLAEPMYRRLMSLQAQQGRHPEALETYRSCRHMLSVVLGLQPSAETEAVRRSWLEAG